MSLNLFVPGTQTVEESSIKDKIVLILTSEFPLSLRQIHSILRNKYSCRTSLQATHKALAYLELSKVIIRDQNKQYSLSKEWINKLRFFVNELEQSYLFLKGFPQIGASGNLSIELKTIADVDRFILSKLDSYPNLGNRTKAVAFLDHLWWPLFYSFKEYLQIREISKKVDLTINCRGNSSIDLWCADYYRECGIKVKTGFNHKHSEDVILFSDYVIQIFYPKAILSKIRRVFSSYKKINDIKIAPFYEKIFEKKHDVQILVNKNEDLAREFLE